MIAATDDAVQKLLHDWHEAGRAEFQRQFPNLEYDSEWYAKTAKDGKRWIKLDTGDSGAYMLDKNDGRIFRIKGYGVPHLHKPVGVLGTVTGAQLCNARGW